MTEASMTKEQSKQMDFEIIMVKYVSKRFRGSNKT